MFERRLHVLMIGLGFFFMILVFRFFFLQVIRGEHYYRSVRENRRQIQYYRSQRGRILDRNGVVLARNRQSRDIAIVMRRILKREAGYYRFDMSKVSPLTRNLAEVTGRDRIAIWNKLDEVYQKITRTPFVYKGETMHDSIVLFQDVGDDIATAIELNRYTSSGTVGKTEMVDRYPGIEITTSQIRTYPYGREVCHVVGYTGVMSEEEKKTFNRDDIHETDRIGKCGIERVYEEKLHGFPGKKMVDKYIRDKKIVYDVLKFEVPKPGENSQITIDIRLQQIIIEEIQKFEARSGIAQKGACVILNPQNGEILAMVSYPLYDLNWFVPRISSDRFKSILEHPGKPLLNRCIRGYPPGSTYKPLLAIASQAEGVRIENQICMGSVHIGSGRRQAVFRCWKSIGHGEMDIYGALRESCNVYFYELGQEMGIDLMHHYADIFGFGHQTGIDLARAPEYESPGINPSPDWKSSHGHGGWSTGDTLNTSIGQGFVSASPLQIALFTGMIGTSGSKVVPYLDPDQRGIVAPEQVLEPFNYLNARRGMHQVTMDERGTAYSNFSHLQAIGVDSAGKTGSAEVGGNRRTHSWYCGFCPFVDPVFAYSLVLENAGHGSDAAVPIMAAIMNRVYADDELRKSLGLEKRRYFVPMDELHKVDEIYLPGEEAGDPTEEDIRIIIE